MAMLERLRAEETMGSATAGAVGRSFKAGAWVRRQWSMWQRAARPRRAPAAKATPSDLRSIGIGVRTVSRG